MHHWLRITLLALCTAIGVAGALAVALNKPVSEPSDSKTASRWVIAAPQKSSVAEAAPAPAPPPAPAPMVAPYRDSIAQQVGQLEDALQQIEESSQRRDRSMLRAIGAIQDSINEAPRSATLPAEAPAQSQPPVVADALVGSAVNQPQVVRTAEAPSEVRGEGDDHLTINIQNSDIRAVLETISRETGLNIIASKNVTGTVTANLNGVDIETALGAILKSTGYIAAREGNIIFIGSPTDLAAMNQTQDRIDTRIYRPNYTKAADLQVLFTPLLSTDGKITVNKPSECAKRPCCSSAVVPCASRTRPASRCAALRTGTARFGRCGRVASDDVRTGPFSRSSRAIIREGDGPFFFMHKEVVVSAGTRTRWVTFDCFGTLVNWQAGFAAMLGPFAGDRVLEIVRAYHACERLVEGERPHRSYKDVLVTALVRAAAELGVRLSESDARTLPQSWGSMHLFDDVEPMLAELRRNGFRLAVLTNCDDDLFEETHRTFRKPFDLFLTAERVRCYKPAPWHFRAFERLTGATRHDWVHVACSWYHDIAPAHALGINRVWLDRERTGENPTTASVQIHSAVEVAGAIEEIFESRFSRA